MPMPKKLAITIALLAIAILSIRYWHGEISPARPRIGIRQAGGAKQAAPVRTPPETKAQPAPRIATAEDWAKRFRTSHDYFDFVSRAAHDALAGDGRAALYISRALTTCLLETKLYGKSPDPEAAFNAEWAEKPGALPWMVDRARRDLGSCRRFFKEDAFATLPGRTGGYESISFWRDHSYEDGDPIARAVHAGLALARIPPGPSESDSNVLASTQADIDDAIASADPEALFMIGQTLLAGRFNDPINALAITIAACNLGYDCSAGNEAVFGVCVAADSCAPGLTYSDVVSQGVGADNYAKAYGRAQQFEYALARGDNETLRQFVRLSRRP